jgi:hypothetical protein
MAMAALSTLTPRGVFSVQGPSRTSPIFRNITYIAPFGDGVQTVDAVVVFTEHQLIVRSATDGRSLKVMSFTVITSADYAYSQNPPWRPGARFPLLFFDGGDQHWLALQSHRDAAVMRLDPRSHRTILSLLEARGIKVHTVNEEYQNRVEAERR